LAEIFKGYGLPWVLFGGPMRHNRGLESYHHCAWAKRLAGDLWEGAKRYSMIMFVHRSLSP